MLRGFIRSKAAGGAARQREALKAAGVKSLYEDDRDACVKSVRPGDAVAVLRLSCLATNKPDLRWALTGKERDYAGIFLKGGYVRDIELQADIRDMKTVEAVLLATEDWANERRGQRKKKGTAGGRPRKERTDKHTANIAWLDKVKYPLMRDALASEHMEGWTQSAATRSIKSGGLGPRGAIPGRLPKPRTDQR